MDWKPEHQYFIQVNPPLGGRYQEFPLETIEFLLRGGYIRFERSRLFLGLCHYFTKD